MTALMVLITLMNSAGGKASDLFGELTGIAVLLTMLPYFYSCVDLIRFEGINIRNFVSLICSVLGCVFCFIALMGASSFELAGTFIVSLIILMFYGRKCTSARTTHRITTPPLTRTNQQPVFLRLLPSPVITRREGLSTSGDLTMNVIAIMNHMGVYFKEEPIRELHRALERLGLPYCLPERP